MYYVCIFRGNISALVMIGFSYSVRGWRHECYYVWSGKSGNDSTRFSCMTTCTQAILLRVPGCKVQLISSESMMLNSMQNGLLNLCRLNLRFLVSPARHADAVLPLPPAASVGSEQSAKEALPG